MRLINPAQSMFGGVAPLQQSHSSPCADGYAWSAQQGRCVPKTVLQGAAFAPRRAPVLRGSNQQIHPYCSPGYKWSEAEQRCVSSATLHANPPPRRANPKKPSLAARLLGFLGAAVPRR